jgi:hypothetical protein
VPQLPQTEQQRPENPTHRVRRRLGVVRTVEEKRPHIRQERGGRRRRALRGRGGGGGGGRSENREIGRRKEKAIVTRVKIAALFLYFWHFPKKAQLRGGERGGPADDQPMHPADAADEVPRVEGRNLRVEVVRVLPETVQFFEIAVPREPAHEKKVKRNNFRRIEDR